MRHEIDLKNKPVRTDLAIDEMQNIGKSQTINNIKITEISLDKKDGEKLGKKEGKYITIEFPDITDYDNREKIKTILTEELKKLIKAININEESSCLIIGLGNEKVTPDSIGPLTLKQTLITNHLYIYGQLEEGYRRVWGIAPGVMGQTGIETSDLINSIVKTVKPDFVIIVDALASSSVERVNKTIQMTDAGINPGSGVGNKRKEINKNTLGAPVIAVGIPTVVDAAGIVSDTIKYMYHHFAYQKENYNKPAFKLSAKVNYLKQKKDIIKKDKENLFGLMGTLDETQTRKLIYEVLDPIGYNLMVTPKEEDFIAEKIAEVIASSINKALHKNVE